MFDYKVLIDQIKAQVSIESLIDSLKKSGNNYKRKCPFHNDATPSFFVFPESQSYYCFGCKVHGDIFQFAMDKYGLATFSDAVEYFCTQLKIPFPKKEKTVNNYRRTDKQVLSDLVIHFHENLVEGLVLDIPSTFQELKPEQKKSLRFLMQKKRFRFDEIVDLQFGYCPKGWLNNLLQDLKTSEKQMNCLEQLKRLGLLSQNNNFLLEGRIIIPIKNNRGEIVSLAGRILDDAKGQPKYINGANSDYFKKSELLFGLGNLQSRELIKQTGEIYLVEGYFDVLALNKFGWFNAAAPMGTSLSDSHFKLLEQLKVKTLNLCLDSDEAGFNSVIKILEERVFCDNPTDINIKIIMLPENKDPDEIEFLELREIFWKRQSVIEFMLTKFGNGNAGQLNNMLFQLYKLISRISNEVTREFYLTKIGKKLNLSKTAIISQYREYLQENKVIEKPAKLVVGNLRNVPDSDVYKEFAVKFIAILLKYNITSSDFVKIRAKDGSKPVFNDFYTGSKGLLSDIFLTIMEVLETRKNITLDDFTEFGVKVNSLLELVEDYKFQDNTAIVSQLNFLYTKLRLIQIEAVQNQIRESLEQSSDETEINSLFDIVELLSNNILELES